MGCKVLYANPEEVLEEKEWENIRKEIHKSADQWLEKVRENMSKKKEELEKKSEGEKKKKYTLDEISQAVFEMRGELTGMITQSMMMEIHKKDLNQESMVCPHCKRILKSRELEKRTVETMVGAVNMERPYFYCTKCKEGFCPSDQSIGLSKRKKQWDIQKAGVRLAVELPYETASQLFKELTGVSMSNHIMHEVTEEASKDLDVLAVSPSAEEIKERIKKISAGKKRRPILVLAIDGADVPTRPEEAKGQRAGRKKERAKRKKWEGEWREAKGYRFYLVEKGRIVHLVSWHQVQSDEGLKESLRQIKESGLIPEEMVRMCIVADGAKWIWNLAEELFPDAAKILDYYHCSEHLHEVAALKFSGKPEEEREWVEATLARLFLGEIKNVISGLKRMKAVNQQTSLSIEKLIGYLKNNQDRVNYGSAKKGGYPIGSGGIESANKFISHVRLKRSGAWWYVEKANSMLALRCAKYNGTFDKVIELYRKNAHQKVDELL